MPANGADGGSTPPSAPAPASSSSAAPAAPPAAPDPLAASGSGGGWASSVRVRLLLLLAIVAVPIVALTISTAMDRHRQDFDDAQRDVRTLLIAAVSRHNDILQGTRDVLVALSGVPQVLSTDAAVCQPQLRAITERFRERLTSISVFDGGGRVTCSALPFEPGRDVSSQDFFRDTLAARDFTVSYFSTGSVTGQGIVVAAYPIIADGAVQGMIIAAIRLAYLASLSNPADLPPASQFFLSDSRGRVLSATADSAALEYHRDAVLRSAPGQRGTVVDRPGEGGRFVYASMALDNDLRATIAVPNAAILERSWVDLLRRIGETGLLFVLSVVAVMWGANFLVLRPLRSLARAAVNYRGAGTALPIEGDMSRAPREIRELATRFEGMTAAAAERELRLQALVEQRELLVKEMHHRVKNNLQIVSSLLSLQSQRIRSPAARAEFQAARDRVRALALLHRHLYGHGDLETIDFLAFARELVEQIHGLLDDDLKARVAVSVEMDRVRLEPDKAVPLGLVITEAVSNAFKYAFPDDREGRVAVRFAVDGQEAVLTVVDDGVGAEPGGEAAAEGDPEGGGLGRVLMAGFAQQLGGELAVATDGGTRVTLRFPMASGPPAGG